MDDTYARLEANPGSSVDPVVCSIAPFLDDDWAGLRVASLIVDWRLWIRSYKPSQLLRGLVAQMYIRPQIGADRKFFGSQFPG
jgi:hypothetical protein